MTQLALNKIPGFLRTRCLSATGLRLVLAALPLLIAGSILAQPISSPADALLRQQERENILREQQERTFGVRLPQPETPLGKEHLLSNEAGCIDIKQITLTGDAAVQFQWALAFAHKLADGTSDPAINRCLGTRGVNLVMRRIQNALVTRGFVLAQVLAGPQQYLAKGTLVLTLFPGRIRHIAFAQGTSPRATRWNAFPARAGDVLNLRDIEQALENFKRLPTVEASVEFHAAEGPGAEPGQTDVIITWKQRFPFRVSFFADDTGIQATGKYQGSLTLSRDHGLMLNDLLYVSLNHDLGKSGTGTGPYGTRGYTAHYSIPSGYWLLSVTRSGNRYHQSVAGPNQTYLYSGESHNSELKLSRVVYRDAVRKTTVSVRGWARSSKNYIDDTEIQVQRRRMAGWELGLSHREFISAALLEASLHYRRGTGAGGSLTAPEEAFGEGTARPKIITAEAQWSVPFRLADNALTYTGIWRGQWNKTPLIAQDHFAIGSRVSVRGFDGENQLSAERGWLLRNDLAVAVGQRGQALYAGIDYGQVAGKGSAFLAGKHLSGAALGVRSAHKHFSCDLFIAKPLSKPGGFRAASRVVGFTFHGSF